MLGLYSSVWSRDVDSQPSSRQGSLCITALRHFSPLHNDFTVGIVIDRLNYGMPLLCASYKQVVCHVLLADISNTSTLWCASPWWTSPVASERLYCLVHRSDADVSTQKYMSFLPGGKFVVCLNIGWIIQHSPSVMFVFFLSS